MGKKPPKGRSTSVGGSKVGVEDALNVSVGADQLPTALPAIDPAVQGIARTDSFGDGELDINEMLSGAPAGGPPKPPMNTCDATGGFDDDGLPEPPENWGDCH